MKITKTTGVVRGIYDLSPSAREVLIELADELDIVAGCFINLFIEINAEKIRRAYSISSDPKEKKNITLSIRKSPNGAMSPLFWNESIIGTSFEVIGPLGVNTADKMIKDKWYLVAFGIGVSVINSLLLGALSNPIIKEIYILTGSRNESEVLYKDIFNIHYSDKIISVKNIISDPLDKKYKYIGYIQNHIQEYDFNNADIYICGMEKACDELEEKIKEKGCEHSEFFIEGFH